MPASDESHQEIIPGMERYLRTPSTMEELLEKNRPIAFGRVVMPYFFRLDESNYTDIPVAHIEAADPRRLLLPHLLPLDPAERDYMVDGVALSSGEYERVVRNPRAFIQKISNTTYQARQLDHNLQRRTDAASRSEVHALESKHAAMQKTLQGIVAEQGVIEKLAKEARSPGYAHVRARDLLQVVGYVHDVVFDRMLSVVGIQKKWNNEANDAARKAFDYRLFFTGRDRVGNWREALKAAEIYGGARERLFHDRVKVVGAALLTRTVAVEEVAD